MHATRRETARLLDWPGIECFRPGVDMSGTADTDRRGRLPVLAMTVAALVAAITVLAATMALRWALPDEPVASPSLSASNALVAEGLAAYRAGDLTAAADAFGQAIELTPEDAVAVYDLGTVREAQGDPAAARELYTRAVELDPSFADGHFNLAVSQAAAGEDQAAIASYRRLLDLDPQRPSALWNLGLLLHSTGDEDEAVVLLRKAIDLDASFAPRLPAGIDLG